MGFVPRPESKTQKIALLGSYAPRQCGIATFGTDLACALGDLESKPIVHVIAMDDHSGADHPPEVKYIISESETLDYVAAAEFVNENNYDLLSVQHEFGIFGGDSGSHLLEMVRAVRVPIVVTLHTVLAQPSESQRKVLEELLQLCERVIVMSHRAKGILQDNHQICDDQIDLIHHGIPLVAKSAGIELRKQLHPNTQLLLTFGLLSPDKGIEFAIRAMPTILDSQPHAVYYVVGATHPHVRTAAGESYRDMLTKTAAELGVQHAVKFVDRFVSKEELLTYLSAMDIYITPYLNPNQITSGTLAYSVGAGKAVVSTPYRYAEELLSNGRGMLIPFRDSNAIAKTVISVLSDPTVKSELSRRAGEFGKQMLWPEVATSYRESFSRAIRDHGGRIRSLVELVLQETQSRTALPEISLSHLNGMTDDTGIFQHANFDVPNRIEGYCVDDNARALLLMTYLDQFFSPDSIAGLRTKYLSFVLHSFNSSNQRFRNFLGFDRKWLEESGSDDSNARALWSLGAVAARAPSLGQRTLAANVFRLGAESLNDATSLRPLAYGILAAAEFRSAESCADTAEAILQSLAIRLYRAYEKSRSDGWGWFEEELTYANARLPQALIVAGQSLENKAMMLSGLDSLDWLMTFQTGPSNCFCPVGTNGFASRAGNRAVFDQQPIEACASVSACLTAYRATNSARWLGEARRAFGWFLGENQLEIPMSDCINGSCFDGLHAERVNLNCGAESTLSYLLALTELRMVTPSKAPGHDKVEPHGIFKTN